MPDSTSTNTTDQAQVASGSPQAQVATSTTPVVNEHSSQIPEEFREEFEKLRHENRNLRKRFNDQESAAKQAEDARLYEQGEFKALAEQHEAKVKELEPIATRYSDLAELISKQIDADIRQWPDEVKSLDPGKDAPVETRLAWVAKARLIAEKMTGAQFARANAPGASRGPRPQGQAGEPSQQDLVKAMRTGGKYGF